MGRRPAPTSWNLRAASEAILALTLFVVVSILDYAMLLHLGLSYGAPWEIRVTFVVFCMFAWAAQCAAAGWLACLAVDAVARAWSALVKAVRVAVYIGARL